MSPAGAGEPLRFAMVTTFYPPYHFGGDALYVYRLSEALAAAGHEVEVLHSIDAFRLHHPAEPTIEFDHHPRVERHGLTSRRPRLNALLAHQLGRPGPYAAELERRLAVGGFDVIHYHNVSLLGGPGVLRSGNALKLYTAHEYWLVCPTHVLFRFDREACERRTCLACTLHARRPPQLWRHGGSIERGLDAVDRLLMPSCFARDRHRALGIDQPMEVLPHFVPDPPAEGGDPLDEPPGRPYFLAVGRLERLKGFHRLIPLFARTPLAERAELWVVGAGSYEGELRARARGLDHIRFLGALHPDRLRALYRNAVALLAPSLCYETFGMTVAEAFAQGTPAIVRRLGATHELIEVSGAGFGFSTDEQCERAMLRLLDEPALGRELGEQGRRAVAEHWSQAAHLEAYLGLVERLRDEQRAERRGERRGERR